MDYLALAGAFANIVSLIGMFKSEHQSNSTNQYEDFLTWLETHHHSDILQAIQSNNQLVQSLRNLLQSNQTELLDKIAKIDTLLLEISSNISGFSELANLFTKQIQISEQAKSILKQLTDSQGSFFFEIKFLSGIIYQIADGNGMNITFTEPRFIEDDLNQLCSMGLLRLDYDSKGNRKFYITRLAVQLVS